MWSNVFRYCSSGACLLVVDVWWFLFLLCYILVIRYYPCRRRFFSFSLVISHDVCLCMPTKQQHLLPLFFLQNKREKKTALCSYYISLHSTLSLFSSEYSSSLAISTVTEKKRDMRKKYMYCMYVL